MLTAEGFSDFFEAVHTPAKAPATKRAKPFRWQTMLANNVAQAGWPSGISLPTASGKTACLDIAIYCLALSADTEHLSPRRVFFVVDRRIVVDEAFRRATKIAQALKEPRSEVVAEVASRLLNCNEPLSFRATVSHCRPADFSDSLTTVRALR
jgi:CRISPR-associated endonuclease/helicase Cas3